MIRDNIYVNHICTRCHEHTAVTKFIWMVTDFADILQPVILELASEIKAIGRRFPGE